MQKESEKQRMLDAKSAEIKKLVHVHKMKNIWYNLNEITLDADFLYKRKNYSNRWTYYRENFLNDKNYEVSHKRRFYLFWTLIASVVAGYYWGQYVSDTENNYHLLESLIIEEQIYAHLLGKADPE